MEERIKAVRKDSGLSQELFGKRLGLTGATISRLESGDRTATDAFIISLCREFGTDEHWLRTGEGEMRKKEDLDDAKYMARLMFGMSEDKKKLFRLIVNMPDELLDEMISYIKKEIK